MIRLAYPRCILLIKQKMRAMSACVFLQGQLIEIVIQFKEMQPTLQQSKKQPFIITCQLDVV